MLFQTRDSWDRSCLYGTGFTKINPCWDSHKIAYFVPNLSQCPNIGKRTVGTPWDCWDTWDSYFFSIRLTWDLLTPSFFSITRQEYPCRYSDLISFSNFFTSSSVFSMRCFFSVDSSTLTN